MRPLRKSIAKIDVMQSNAQSRRYKSRSTNTVHITVFTYAAAIFSLKIAIHAFATTCLSRSARRSFSTSAAYSVQRRADSRVASCKWHLKIAHGYERDPRVVPALRDGLAQPSAQMRRGLPGQTRRERIREVDVERGGGEFFRLTATIISKSIRCAKGLPGLIRGGVHLVVLALRLPEVANRELRCLLPSGLRWIANTSPSHSALPRMLADDSPDRNSGMSTAHSSL